MKTVTNVYAVCAFAALGGCLFGMDIASMSGVLGTSAYKNYFNHPRSFTQGYITASMPLGSIFSTLGSSCMSDRFSRKIAIQLACILWIIGSAYVLHSLSKCPTLIILRRLQSGSNGVPMLCVGRFVAGLGVGIASAVVPVYQAEIAPKEIRGRVVTLQQWAITWGILIQYFVQYGASHVGNGPDSPTQSTAAFRIPWALQTIPAFILAIGLFWFPYSPRWLAGQDRWEEAIMVLADLHAHGNVKHPKVLAQYREIEEALRFEKEVAAAGWSGLLDKKIAKRVLSGMSVQTWAQLCGMNVMMYYIVYIMETANIGTPLLTASIQYIINVVLTLPAILYIDTWGRRPTLLLGALSMMALLFTSGALQAIYGTPTTVPDSDLSWHIVDNAPASRGVVACSYLFVATFAVSWGPVSWTYPAEIFPNRVRAKGTSLTTATNWVFNTVLAFAVPPLLYRIGWRMYILFGTFNAIAFVQVFFTIPETKQFSLEEMDAVFEGPAWRGPKKESRLDDLELQIECGVVDVRGPKGLDWEDRGSWEGSSSMSKGGIGVETTVEMRESWVDSGGWAGPGRAL
ncbi:general substrate transporter [Pseudovirgaria hyperparasitica]|uniref:General substrate transporter n=1 Tax=Pseudovirgaria hyperparasitica TaxID=470096 RepID=A0A6A6VZD0_9PEZI|nr:general substrate transporter [Pseudovirgaria hyperparasitica]KAF2755585.1 general substrate transporter [Pseudovirgaria hyperparasitica]